MCDHIDRAFPDDVPRSAFVPLTEHYTTKNHSQHKHRSLTHFLLWITIIIACFFYNGFHYVRMTFMFTTRQAKWGMRGEKTNTHDDPIVSPEVTNQSWHEDVWLCCAEEDVKRAFVHIRTQVRCSVVRLHNKTVRVCPHVCVARLSATWAQASAKLSHSQTVPALACDWKTSTAASSLRTYNHNRVRN